MVWWLRRLVRMMLILMLTCTLLLIFLRSKYDAVMVALTRTQVTNSTSDLINDAIAQQISTGRIEYDRIVYFEKDLNGKITALKTNIGEVNKLKTDTLNMLHRWAISSLLSKIKLILLIRRSILMKVRLRF